MRRSLRRAVILWLLGLWALWAAGVKVRFDPASPEVGPFPTDFLTTPDGSQKNGQRVNLPLPDCNAQPSSCQELALVNQLDGFNLQPRLRVRFTAAINPDSLRQGIFFVWLENLTREEPGLEPAGHFTPINQVIYDPATQTAYGKPDEFLDQHRRYALVVTDAVRDPQGDPVEPDGAFLACLAQTSPDRYCEALAPVVNNLAAVLAPRRIVAASVFTTSSATAWMEKARAVVQASPLNLQPASPQSAFAVADLASIAWRQQVRANPPAFRELEMPMSLLAGVGRLAFASFRSPSFLNAQQSISGSPSGAEVALPDAANEIFFHAYLPASVMPAGGYPVVIFGHGLGDSRFGGPTALAATFARNGFATVAISAVGHGYGPESKLVLKQRDGRSIELAAPGRAVDLNGDGAFDASEGCVIIPGPVGLRDCLRQTALDLTQLVRAIRTGLDFDGDGVIDLDRSRIYYAGQSLGSYYGVILNAVEPGIAAAAFSVGGGSVVETARWSPSFRPLVTLNLALRNPPMLNRGFNFDENYVLRDQPVKVNDVPGAVAIQNLLETTEWIEAPGDPVAYAPHLRSASLATVGAKPVLWQFAKGDQTVPNPASSNLIRAATVHGPAPFYQQIARSRATPFPNFGNHFIWFYRHDLARAAVPQLGTNPHAYLTNVLGSAPEVAIALAVQQQIAGFFASGGRAVPDVNDLVLPAFGRALFEVPAFLTEDLNF